MSLDEDDPDGQTLLVRYPSAVPADAYVRSEVRLECGAKSALNPHVGTVIRPYVSDDVPDADLTVNDVTTIQATRTFWDKVVIAHRLRGWFQRICATRTPETGDTRALARRSAIATGHY